MNLLAFDTSTSACSVALVQEDTLLSSHKIAPMQQAGLILPTIQQLLDEANLALSDLHAIAFGCGPGSYTGIRIASSVAQGISFAYSIPIIQISSLAATAQAAYDELQWPKLMLPWMRAWSKSIGLAMRLIKGLVRLIGQEKACSPADVNVLKIKADCSDWYGVGDGWEQYKEPLLQTLGFQPRGIEPRQSATAKAVAKLAIAELQDGKIGVSASQVSPVYLR